MCSLMSLYCLGVNVGNKVQQHVDDLFGMRSSLASDDLDLLCRFSCKLLSVVISGASLLIFHYGQKQSDIRIHQGKRIKKVKRGIRQDLQF
jgi:hypothetical protein